MTRSAILVARVAVVGALATLLPACQPSQDESEQVGAEAATAADRGSAGGHALGLEALYIIDPDVPVPLADGDVFALRPDGGLVVFDLASSRVHQYGASGVHEGSFGNRGQGPGEIRGGDDLVVGPRGEIVVVQFLNFRITAWTAEGESLWDRPLDGSVTRLAAEGDTLWVKRAPRLGASPVDPVIMEALDLATGASLGVSASIDLDRGPDGPTLGPTCLECAWAAAPGGTFLSPVVDSDRGTVVSHFRPDGSLIRVFANLERAERPRFDSELRALADYDHERIMRIARTMGMTTMPAPRSVERLAEIIGDHPRYLPQGVGGFDAFGRLWVLAAPRAPDSGALLEVFGEDGDLLGEIPLDVSGAVELQVRDRHLAVRSRDEHLLPGFHVYRIVPP